MTSTTYRTPRAPNAEAAPAWPTSAPPTAPAAADRTVAEDLIAALAVTADDDPDRPALRARTIEAWLGWAHRHARRYASGRRPTDDLRQVAALGLIKAVDGYNPWRGDRFEPYATVTIRGELKRHFRDQAWDLRVPRRLQELVLALTPVKDRLQHELHRSPTVDELARALDLPAGAVLEALAAADSYYLVSLQTPIHGFPDGDTQLGDSLGRSDPALESATDRLTLHTLVARLKPRDRTIVTLRFFGNRTQSEIADELGISQMHVSRLLTTALRRLHTALTSG